MASLGSRLRDVRIQSGLSLREVARQIGVSPSFLSQLENGKSQPSVATLYSITQLLEVSIDDLFSIDGPSHSLHTPAPGAPVVSQGQRGADGAAHPLNRSDFGSPADAFPRPPGLARVSISRPGERPRLEMDTGVIWERLVDNTGTDLDFIEIIYPPHSSSTHDDRMLQHPGSEFGLLLEGNLEIKVGFDVFMLHPGEALGFDSSQPHLFRNRDDTPARGVWFVRHPQG